MNQVAGSGNGAEYDGSALQLLNFDDVPSFVTHGGYYVRLDWDEKTGSYSTDQI